MNRCTLLKSIVLSMLSAAMCLAMGTAAHPAEIAIIRSGAGRPMATARRAPLEDPRGGGGGLPELQNGDFSAGLSGWDASQSGGGLSPGEARADAGGALLSEGDSFLVTLEQTFVVPEDAGLLTFRLVLDPGFDVTDDFIPDAFEVSLLAADNAPVIGTWDSLATSSLNLAEGGSVNAAPGVAWDGSTAQISLHTVAPGTVVTLYFDLIGADADTASGLRLDDVALGSGPAPGAFVRGDHDGSRVVDAADAEGILAQLFAGGATAADCLGEPSLDAADANDNEWTTVADYLALRAAIAAGAHLSEPTSACGLDPGDDQRGFDQVAPDFRVLAGELELLTAANDPSPRVALPVLVAAPRPLGALTLILEYDSRVLTPFDPGSGDPAPLAAAAADARSALLLEPGRMVIAIWADEPRESLIADAPGTFQRVATVSFHLARFEAVRPFRWLAEGELGGVRHRATLVDEAFADHHPEPLSRDHEFVRGNANADQRVDLSDSVFTLGYLFLGSNEPICLDAADANNDSALNITDAIFALSFLFLGGPPIPPPYPECGIDIGPADLLGCGEGACPE
jgi:hypothetical protein